MLDFRDAEGNRRWESFRTRREADDALSKRINQVDKGSYVPPKKMPLFREVATDWLASKADRRVSTLAQWQVHLDLHILPALGPLRLNQIRVRQIEEFRDERLATGLAPQTVNKLLTTASAVFKFAIRRELIDRNPAASAERCVTNSGEVSIDDQSNSTTGERAVSPDDILSPEEVSKLIAAAKPGFYQTYFLTAALTGGRVGELTGLTWSDIDLGAGTISIRRSVSWAKPRGTKGRSKPRFYEPKTRRSKRTLHIPPELVAALKRWKLACPVTQSDLVFPNADGTPRNRSTIAHDGLRPALREAKLRRVTLHSLRHSFASALIMNGSPVTEVSTLLGHSNPTITLSVYSHWFQDAKTDAVAKLAARICPSGMTSATASTA